MLPLVTILLVCEGVVFYQRTPSDGRTLVHACGCTLALTYARLKVCKYACPGDEATSCAVARGATAEETYGRERSSVEKVGPSVAISHPSTPPGIDMLDGVIDGALRRGGHVGDGSTLYVLDSGIFCGHQEFAKARSCTGIMGFDSTSAINGDAQGGVHSVAEDCSLHGTAVASAAAGVNVGVAWDVNIVSLQVMNCEGVGTTDYLFEAIDRIKDHKDTNNVTTGVLVASLSMDSYSADVNAEFDDLVEDMPTFFAAGNFGDEAGRRSPASALLGFSVGALSSPLTGRGNLDAAHFSNYGKYVQLYAAGALVRTAGRPPDNYLTLNGTSFAAPVVAGMALAMRGRSISSSTWQIYEDLLKMASNEYVDGWGYQKMSMLQRVARLNYTALNQTYVLPQLTPLIHASSSEKDDHPSDEVKTIAFSLMILWIVLAVLFLLCYIVSLSYPMLWTKGTPITTSLPK